MCNLHKTILFVALAAGAFVPGAFAADAVSALAWTLPAWTANDAPIEGALTGDVVSDGVGIRFRLNEGEVREAAAVSFSASDLRVDFVLPKLSYEAFGMVEIWAEDESGERLASAPGVAIADWHEFDITGQTDVELLFPIEAWGMQIRFTPCCLILAGYLRVERIGINPIGKADGLPETLVSKFLRLAPDDTVIATAGLNADITIDPDSAFAAEDITVYRWAKGKWAPVIGAELHVETNTIRFQALEGGFFVLGPKRL